MCSRVWETHNSACSIFSPAKSTDGWTRESGESFPFIYLNFVFHSFSWNLKWVFYSSHSVWFVLVTFGCTDERDVREGQNIQTSAWAVLPYICFGRLLDIVNTDKTIKQFEKFIKITKIAFVLLLYLCKEYSKEKVISSLVFAKFCEKNEKKRNLNSIWILIAC